MSDVSALQYANVDEHMAAAGSLHKAMLPMGFVTAFCFHHQLLSRQFYNNMNLLWREYVIKKARLVSCLLPMSQY
jgi:hypothetical protein